MGIRKNVSVFIYDKSRSGTLYRSLLSSEDRLPVFRRDCADTDYRRHQLFRDNGSRVHTALTGIDRDIAGRTSAALRTEEIRAENSSTDSRSEAENHGQSNGDSFLGTAAHRLLLFHLTFTVLLSDEIRIFLIRGSLAPEKICAFFLRSMICPCICIPGKIVRFPAVLCFRIFRGVCSFR